MSFRLLLVCGDISFTVYCFCRSRLSVTLSTKSAKFCSRYRIHGSSEGDKISHFVSPGLAVHQCRDWSPSAQKVLLWFQNTEGIKFFCNAFLIHLLAESDEIWHSDGHWWTLVHFSGSTNFQLQISRTLLFGGWRNLAPLGVWPMDPNFVNFGPGVQWVSVSEQFLNGTSAHYRVFSATNGG